MTKTLVIARRELASMFGGPLAWVLTGVFAMLAGYFFYSDLTFYVLFGGANLSSGLWRYVFLDYRMVAMLVLPLVTMRLLAEERKLGTLELLWTLPVRDGEVIAGKFLAALVAYLAMLLATMIGPVVLWLMHPFAPGPVLAGYVGMLLLGAAVHRLRARRVGGDGKPGRERAAHIRRAGAVVVPRLERSGAQRAHRAVVSPRCRCSIGSTASPRARSTAATWPIFLAFVALFLFLALRALGARAWRGVS